MTLYLVLVLCSYPLHWVLLEKAKNQVLALVRYLCFAVIEEQLAVENVLEHLLVIAVVERRRSVDHFVYEDAERPPVCHERLALAAYYLRT